MVLELVYTSYGMHMLESGIIGSCFLDNVNYRGEVYIFIWDGAEESAKLLSKKNNEKIRFKWLEDDQAMTI